MKLVFLTCDQNKKERRRLEREETEDEERKKCGAGRRGVELIGGQPSGNVHGLKIGECVM